jgi:hypothetical protein
MAKHSIAVGETYQDRKGPYKVLSVDGNILVYEYADGIKRTGDATTKWTIQQNIHSDQITQSLQQRQLNR